MPSRALQTRTQAIEMFIGSSITLSFGTLICKLPAACKVKYEEADWITLKYANFEDQSLESLGQSQILLGKLSDGRESFQSLLTFVIDAPGSALVSICMMTASAHFTLLRQLVGENEKCISPIAYAPNCLVVCLASLTSFSSFSPIDHFATLKLST
jgi:hypothetical protein